MDFLDIQLEQVITTSETIRLVGSIYADTTTDVSATAGRPAHTVASRVFIESFDVTVSAATPIQELKALLKAKLDTYNATRPANQRYKANEIFT